jgi:electron transport complex protein RnfE
LPALVDGFGMGLGFLLALVVTAAVRELFGVGRLAGYPVFGTDYPPILMIVLAPGGFITIGLLIGLFRVIGQWRDKRAVAATTDVPAPAATGEVSHA